MVLVIVVAALCAAAALAIAVLILGEFGDVQGRILMSCAALAAFGLLGLPAAALVDRGRGRPLAAAVVVAAAAGFALFMAMLWWGDDPPAGLLKATASVCAVAVALAQVAALWARRRDGDPGAVRTFFLASCALAGVLAAMVVVAVSWEIEAAAYYRLLGVLVVLDVLLVALQPTLARLAAARVTHPLRVVLATGERRDVEVAGRDLASAMAAAVRSAEREGGTVVRVERSGEPPA